MADWSKPHEVSAAKMVFPAGVIGDLLPEWAEIPDEFKRHRGTEWNKIVSSWFYKGLPAEVEFHVKEGVDGEMMMRHIQACLGSFEPKHEHKEAGVAYLLSLWNTKIDKWKASK